MDRRFPYDSPRDQQRQPPQVGSMNPLDLEEALYMHRQQEYQRDLHLRQIIIQEQIDRQQSLRQQRIYGLQQQIAGQQALASLQREEQAMQEQIRRRRLLQPHLGLSAASSIASPVRQAIMMDAMAVDSLAAANASRLSAGNRKRSLSTGESSGEVMMKKRARMDSSASSNGRSLPIANSHSDAAMLADTSVQIIDVDDAAHGADEVDPELHKKPKAKEKAPRKTPSPDITHEALAIEGFQALRAAEAKPEPTHEMEEEEEVLEEDENLYTKGTIESLLAAGVEKQEVDDAATVIVTLQDVGELSESEDEQSYTGPVEVNENAVSIVLPGFRSKLPLLPVEPEYEAKSPEHKSPEEGKEADKDTDASSREKKNSQGKETGSNVDQNGHKGQSEVVTIQPTEYPYPVDTWWPSIPTVRRERRMNGENTDDESFMEDPNIVKEDSMFRGDLRRIQSRLASDVQPGVLEKIPHCKIHRLRTRSQKGANIPDHAFCWQVTETYCTDIMVCCSICSTWRHAGCGGHYKPYSIRDNIESKEPFVPICDICHEEQELLQDFPRGAARLERQRIEQLRRALSTSAVIRQASFIKHGGTYKWPLGSVSATHIGGHTRSVHSRHDKAEKTWSEMITRLGRGFGYRPKERQKVRTREFERLLVCVEDAEGLTERHNMIQFLENDSRKEYPAGYEKHLRNIFDPDDDDHRSQGEHCSQEEHDLVSAPSQQSPEDVDTESHQGMLVGRRPPPSPSLKLGDDDETSSEDEAICARRGCCKSPRFDSIFCSDSCGILELERDLLVAMYVAEEMHPSLMRA